MNRMLEISTKAGPDAFAVRRLSGREELGRLFEYTLELVSERGDITSDQMLGSNATVQLELPGGQAWRYFNGYVTSFSVLGAVTTPAYKSNTGFLYLVTLNPGGWFRTRSSNSRIFSSIAIGDLIAQQLNVDSLMTIDNQVGATEQRDFIVQYRETDFAFVSRLAEHAGIYYYFTHDNGSHKMVLVNDSGKHKSTPGLSTVSFAGAAATDGTVTGFTLVSQVQPGAFATGDYNYVVPNTRIAAVDSHPKAHDNAGFEMFDYPIDTGTSGDAVTYASIRAQELACRHTVAHGAGTERNIQVGFKTTLKDHSVDALNLEYLVIGHSFVANNNLAQTGGGATGSFDCEFEAIPASVQFRSTREVPRPFIPGTQTALVVSDFSSDTDASKGANIGRVKVQFFWDRYGKQSCWARVSTPWAGKGYGFQNMPRVGEEVLVQFLEGDPDRPVVIGRVHNAENMPPFKLPASAPFTGLKTLSMSADGKSVAGKWNELRFDDTDGREQIYVQAQLDFDRRVLNDDKSWIGNESHHYVKADAYDKFDADHHVKTTGDHNETIGGQWSTNVTSDIHVRSGSKFLVDGGDEVHLLGKSKVVLESSMSVSLVCGASFITIGPSSIAISAPQVNVNSGGSAGSGSSVAPQPPKDAKDAMTSEGGAKTVTPAAPPAPKAFSPQASSFLVAAATAAPFVASCAG